jgi:SrtB family sortase
MERNAVQGRYSRKTAGPGKAAVLSGIAACLIIAAAGGGMVLHRRNQAAAEAAQAYQEAVDAAAAASAREEALFTQLTTEGLETASINASDLSKTFHAQWEERREGSTSGGYTWVNPATGEFVASAYGDSGAGNIAYWKSINSDVVGWLRVPGTNIDWPIVQNTQDVNYYTHLGYDKQYSYNGVIWTNPTTRTSASSSGLSNNTVIYGHNWTNYSASPRIGYPGDVMFAQLTGYHWLAMAQSYPYFYYSTAQGGEFVVKIFACFYTELAFDYIESDGDMSYIISEAQRRSRHTFDVDVNASDKIVTLSTCTRAYGSTSNQRFVVMGRLLRPGETIEPVTVTSNPNHKQPSVW